MASRNQFYSVKLKGFVTIPTNRITSTTTRNGRKMLIGTYTVGGKTFKATKFV